MSLDVQSREKIYSRVCALVTRKHFDPGMNGANWEELSKASRDKILQSRSDEEFEKQIQGVLNELKTSHTGFRHSKSPNVPGRHAISATFMRCNFDGEQRWMFQDVHEGGPAHVAGLRPGDILLQVRNRELKPPDPPIFPLGDESQYVVQKPDGKRVMGTLQVPNPRSKNHPVIVPKAVVCSQLPEGIGWLKVTMFPGAVGIDLAHMLDTAFAHLKDSSRLIVDLRGNTGGGIGGLRLMSYLTPGKTEVGYSLTRARKERGYSREKLPRFGRIPSHKATLLWLALRYGFIDKSILVVTEGLGPQRFHGREIILVNEHTSSAGEMVAAFAEENKLATIVGTKTPGRLLSGSAFKAGFGYIVGVPVAAYLTWEGRLIEGKGVSPSLNVELKPEQLLAGEDPQMQKALEIARSMLRAPLADLLIDEMSDQHAAQNGDGGNKRILCGPPSERSPGHSKCDLPADLLSNTLLNNPTPRTECVHVSSSLFWPIGFAGGRALQAERARCALPDATVSSVITPNAFSVSREIRSCILWNRSGESNQPSNQKGGASVETARIDLDQLAEHIQWKMEQEDLSLREAAGAARVSPATMSRILRKGKKRPQPDTGTLVHILNWVKLPIEKIIGSPLPPKRTRSDAKTLEVIEVHLRADKNLSPDAAKVITQMVRAAYKQFSKHPRGSLE